MNSSSAKNACLLLVAVLLWHVFSGIFLDGPPHYSYLIKTTLGIESPNRPTTLEEAEQILKTGRLPSTKPGKEGRKLTEGELSRVLETGTVPKY